MTTTTTRKKPLLDEQLEQMFTLIQDADSLELKLTIPESDQRSTVVALGIDPLDAELRQVYFFDTPDLALNKKGVVVRARRVQKKGGDSVVKLRPIVPSEASRTRSGNHRASASKSTRCPAATCARLR